MTVLAAGCGDGSQTATVESVSALPAPASAGTRPMVEVVPARTTPPLDPNADPTTPLGELRARYLPIWSPDFDWAFPPEVCGSDWALDAIAEPTSSANVAVLGDPMAAAALSVMRSEFLLSRARATPSVLAQLCVAVATVGAARSEALEVLAADVRGGSRSIEVPGYPDEVVMVAAGPTAALAVACVTPGYPRVVTGDGEILETPPAPARLGAYLLTVARGLEDGVVDISYRVSDTEHEPAGDCEGLDAWVAAWNEHVRAWLDEGQIWGALNRTVTADELCATPPPGGPDECPRDWLR